jgi:hypothetical protein
MLPGVEGVADGRPRRQLGQRGALGALDNLLARYAAGHRFIFGSSDEYGCTRITVELRENRQVQNYLKLMQANYAVDAPELLARIAVLPGVENWWISATIIAPDCITEICPVGDDTKYNEIVEQIAKANAH